IADQMGGVAPVSRPAGPVARSLRRCVVAALRPSCSGGRKAGVGSGEVSLKLLSGEPLPTLLPLCATPSTAWVMATTTVAAGSGDPRRARGVSSWRLRRGQESRAERGPSTDERPSAAPTLRRAWAPPVALYTPFRSTSGRATQKQVLLNDG